MLECVFQLCSLCVMFLPSSAMRHGPSSKSRPVEELHPGPPLSHRVRGALSGDLRDSKNLHHCQPRVRCILYELGTHQKNKCLPSEMSRYPECCLTEGSQSSGSVTRSW